MRGAEANDDDRADDHERRADDEPEGAAHAPPLLLLVMPAAPRSQSISTRLARKPHCVKRLRAASLAAAVCRRTCVTPMSRNLSTASIASWRPRPSWR